MSHVFYAKQVQEVPPFLFAGVSFLLTAVYFSIFHVDINNITNGKEQLAM